MVVRKDESLEVCRRGCPAYRRKPAGVGAALQCVLENFARRCSLLSRMLRILLNWASAKIQGDNL